MFVVSQEADISAQESPHISQPKTICFWQKSDFPPHQASMFENFHAAAQGRSNGYLKPLRENALKTADFVVQAFNQHGNVIGQCLLHEKGSNASLYAPHPVDYRVDDLILSSLSGRRAFSVLFDTVAGLANEGQNRIIAKTNSGNGFAQETFEKYGYHNIARGVCAPDEYESSFWCLSQK